MGAGSLRETLGDFLVFLLPPPPRENFSLEDIPSGTSWLCVCAYMCM